MKKLFILTVCAIALGSCNEGVKKAEEAAQQQRDSLEQIISQKDNEINDMMTTLSDIEEGFREITEAQNRVTLAKQGEGTNTTQRIKENFQFIQSVMKQNKELINKLKQQVRESSVKGGQLKKLSNLTAGGPDDQGMMKAVQELDEKVADLNTNVTNLTAENTEKAQTISNQDKQLNTAWFVFGTSKELKEHNVLVKGKVLQGDFDKSYFTKIDIRIDKEIKLYSKSAAILTAHPASSYTLERDANKQYVLRITNPQTFWSTSKYLVVQVK